MLRSTLLTAFVTIALLGCAAPSQAQSQPDGPPALDLERVAGGFDQPLALAAPDDGSGRLFVAEKTGRVRVVGADGTVADAPLLDISGEIVTSSEQGLIGLALHPDFAENGRLFAHYSAAAGGGPGVGTVAEFRLVAEDPNRVDAGSRRILLEVEQPFANHNGGHLAFGPDGMLYVALGDGGSGGDPEENGQDASTLLGSILRLDVDGDDLVPDDNPFVGDGERRDEIWAWGLRNPWRFSFDRATDDLWIGDVGQNRAEEISREPAGSEGGRNYGWNVREGFECFEPRTGCRSEGLVDPLFEYEHAGGWGRSVTGGYVYRGAAIPGLEGWYLFGDFVSGRIFAAREEAGEWSFAEPLAAALERRGLRPSVASFGEGPDGELYLVDFGGAVHRIVAAE